MTALVGVWMALVAALAWRWRPPPRRMRELIGSSLRHDPLDRSGQRERRRARAGVAGLAGLGVLLAMAWPPLGALAPLAIYGRRRWVRLRRRRLADEAVRIALPDVIDLFVVAVSAGLTPTLAVRRLAVLAPNPFAAAFAEVGRRIDHGQRMADGLGALVEQLGEPARPLVTAVGGAERYGTPLAPTLELLGQEARRERRRQAEERARTLPVKLCFPLVGCILPAFVLLTIAPLVAGAFRSLTV